MLACTLESVIAGAVGQKRPAYKMAISNIVHRGCSLSPCSSAAQVRFDLQHCSLDAAVYEAPIRAGCGKRAQSIQHGVEMRGACDEIDPAVFSISIGDPA